MRVAPTIVLTFEQKKGLTKLSRSNTTSVRLPLGIGHIKTATHDYVRHDTLTLFAALNYLERKADHSHRRPEPESEAVQLEGQGRRNSTQNTTRPRDHGATTSGGLNVWSFERHSTSVASRLFCRTRGAPSPS